MTELETLRARLDQVEAESAILRTLHAYGHTIGIGDEEGWLDCFTQDALFVMHRRDMGPDGFRHPHPDMAKSGPVTYQGREQLRGFIARHPKPPQRYHKHIAVDPVVTISGASATVASMLMRLDAGPDGAPHLTAFGVYKDELVRCPDGRWRFKSRHGDIQARGADPSL